MKEIEIKCFFGSKVEKESMVYKDQINHDTLLLSFFGKLKLQTKSYRNIFFEIFGIFSLSEIEDEDNSRDVIENLILGIEKSEDEKIKFLKFLKAIDSGIQDVKVKKMVMKSNLSQSIPEKTKKSMSYLCLRNQREL